MKMKTTRKKTMNVFGIGCDIIEVERIQKAIESQGKPFLDRLFTPQEQAYCTRFKNSYSRFAGRFAAKEAIVKALKCGIGEKISWLDIDIISPENESPEVVLTPQALQTFPNIKIHLSISHTEIYALAFATVLTND